LNESTNRPGREFPGVGTGAIIVQEGWPRSLLMVKRKGSHGEGTWCVPGGWVEKWEDPYEGIEREVMEEVGISVAACRDKPVSWTNAFHVNDNIQAVTLWIFCTPSTWADEFTQIMEPDKIEEIRWVSFKSIEKYKLFRPMRDFWMDKRNRKWVKKNSW
jgi:8-oxo-dGTP diphosphatase